MIRVIKRDGSRAPFAMTKIMMAMRKAFKATRLEEDDAILELLALRVSADFQNRMEEGCVHVEAIQDSVERVLSQSGYTQVAKAYILYRRQRENIRNLTLMQLDFEHQIDSYLTMDVKEDNYSLGGLVLANTSKLHAQYWLTRVFDEECQELIHNNKIDILDLGMLAPRASGFSLYDIMANGLPKGQGILAASPSKHINTLLQQMVNLCGLLRNEWASSISFAHFDTYMAAMMHYEKTSPSQLRQALESFLYGLNTPGRFGKMENIVYLSMDGEIPDAMYDQPCMVAGSLQSFRYGDCQKELSLWHQTFIDVMMAKHQDEDQFHSPIITYHHIENLPASLFTLALKYPTIYFMEHHYHNQQLGKEVYVEKTGLLGRVDILDEEDEGLIHKAIWILETKRRFLQRLFSQGLFPYTKNFLNDFNAHLGVIGVRDGHYTKRVQEILETKGIKDIVVLHKEAQMQMPILEKMDAYYGSKGNGILEEGVCVKYDGVMDELGYQRLYQKWSKQYPIGLFRLIP